MTESQLQQASIDLLQFYGWVIIRVNSGGRDNGDEDGAAKKRFVSFVRWFARGFRGQTKGVADAIACSPTGKFFAFEFKVGRRRPTREQEWFLQAVKDCNGGAFVIHSVEELEAAIASEKQSLW